MGPLTPIIGLRLLALAAGLRHNAESGQPGLCFSAYGHKFGINHLVDQPAEILGAGAQDPVLLQRLAVVERGVEVEAEAAVWAEQPLVATATSASGGAPQRRVAPLWRVGCLDVAVDDGVAAFACLVEDAHCAHAVGHLLGESALDRGCLGELGGVEELWQA